MTEPWKSLAHSRWECKYHVVFIPKYRRKAVYGEIRASLGGIFHELARQKECRIVEGHLLADHVHMCIEIPPKHAVASIIGFLKGKSAVAIARQFGGKLKNFTGRTFLGAGLCGVDRGLRVGKGEAVHPGTRGLTIRREDFNRT